MLINNVPFVTDLSDILTELQSQLNLNGIHYLKDIKDTPDNIMVTCPYHKNGEERKPSMGIKKTDGTCHCFTCGEVHSLQEMISFCFGRTDDVVGAFGWNWLLKNFLTISVEDRGEIVLDFDRPGVYEQSNSSSRPDSSNFPGDPFVTEDELNSYRYYHPYMYKRKMTDEVIELFDIGYDEKTRCITFPVRDIKGNTLFIARRSVDTKFFNYPAGAEKPVYGLYELNQRVFRNSFRGGKCAVEVIICESMIDAITCWVYGKYAVALNGLGNDLQFKQLNDMPCRKFILATDMDDAGRKARQRIRSNIKNKLITEYVWDVKVAKDINDMDKEMFDNLKEIL